MRNLTPDNITQAVIESFAHSDDERFKLILERLITHLHAFAREVHLTREEWLQSIGFLLRAGRISDARRNEFMLLSDLLGLSSLVDLINAVPGATQGSLLGPFYADDSPLREWGTNLIQNNAGEPVLLRGRVLDGAGLPINGAMIDFWQATATGLYPLQDETQHPHNLRCRMQTDAEGSYRFTTVRPSPYAVPVDGPGGELLRAGARKAWRPAHFHFKVTAQDFAPLVTELFPADDPYLADDAVFGVRDAIVVDFNRCNSQEDAAACGLKAPFYIVEFDFRLSRATQRLELRGTPAAGETRLTEVS